MESTSTETSAFSPGYSHPWTDYREPKSAERYHVSHTKLLSADRAFPHIIRTAYHRLVFNISFIARLAHLPGSFYTCPCLESGCFHRPTSCANRIVADRDVDQGGKVRDYLLLTMRIDTATWPRILYSLCCRESHKNIYS